MLPRSSRLRMRIRVLHVQSLRGCGGVKCVVATHEDHLFRELDEPIPTHAPAATRQYGLRGADATRFDAAVVATPKIVDHRRSRMVSSERGPPGRWIGVISRSGSRFFGLVTRPSCSTTSTLTGAPSGNCAGSSKAIWPFLT